MIQDERQTPVKCKKITNSKYNPSDYAIPNGSIGKFQKKQ